MFGKKSKNTHELLVEHLNAVKETLVCFDSFMRAAMANETQSAALKPLSVGVGLAEAKADVALRIMIDSLGSGYLASTREDIIELGTACDKIANKCESVARAIVYRHISIPGDFSKRIDDIETLIRKQFDVLCEAIGMFFADFGGMLKNHSILDEIRKMESEVDNIELELKEEAFNTELTLAEKMQLDELLEWLADPSDIIENIADKLQIMLISRKA